jgi:hypothetical protein
MEPTQAYQVLDSLVASAQTNRAGRNQLEEAISVMQQLILSREKNTIKPVDPLLKAALALPEDHVLSAIKKSNGSQKPIKDRI